MAEYVGRKRDAIAKAELDSHKELNGQLDRLVRYLYISDQVDPDGCKKLKDLMDDIAEKSYQKEIDLQYKRGWKVAA